MTSTRSIVWSNQSVHLMRMWKKWYHKSGTMVFNYSFVVILMCFFVVDFQSEKNARGKIEISGMRIQLEQETKRPHVSVPSFFPKLILILHRPALFWQNIMWNDTWTSQNMCTLTLFDKSHSHSTHSCIYAHRTRIGQIDRAHEADGKIDVSKGVRARQNCTCVV